MSAVADAGGAGDGCCCCCCCAMTGWLVATELEVGATAAGQPTGCGHCRRAGVVVDGGAGGAVAAAGGGSDGDGGAGGAGGAAAAVAAASGGPADKTDGGLDRPRRRPRPQ